MDSQKKEAITKKLYSILDNIAHILEYDCLAKEDLAYVKVALACMQFKLDDIEELLDAEINDGGIR